MVLRHREARAYTVYGTRLDPTQTIKISNRYLLAVSKPPIGSGLEYSRYSRTALSRSRSAQRDPTPLQHIWFDTNFQYILKLVMFSI